MTLTSLGAVTSTLVAGPFGSNPLVQRNSQSELDAIAKKYAEANTRPTPSAKELKDNIKNDKDKHVLTPESGFKIAGFQITGDYYKFDPQAYKKEFGKLPTLSDVKYRYDLPDRVIAENNTLDFARNLDSLPIKGHLRIPKEYIDKK